MSSVLVTGATGFVGRAVCGALLARGLEVRAAVRGPGKALPRGVETVQVGDIGPGTDWSAVLGGTGAVVHLAGRVHHMCERAPDPLAAHRILNRDATEALGRAAAAAGVRRLVFASTVKVLGEGRERPYTEADRAAPADPYAVSKWEAEEALRRIGGETGLEVVILRPPLVYGPGVGANFLRLLRWVAGGLPLPFGAIRNRRSLVFVDNLADAVLRASTHPAAAGRTYLVSEGEDLSTPDLVRGIASALGRPARLVPVPPGAIRLAAGALGRRAAAERLLGSLRVDSTAIRHELAWSPPYSTAEGLGATARWFLASRSRGTRA